MRRTIMLLCLLAGAPALAAAGEPRLGLTLGTAGGTTVGALVLVTDRFASRSTLRVPAWGGAVGELDVTGDLLRDRAFVPYLGAGVEMLLEHGNERTESRALVGVRHAPTERVRLFGEAVWHRRLSGWTALDDANVNIRLGAGVSVLF
jgi:hypothetical protein